MNLNIFCQATWGVGLPPETGVFQSHGTHRLQSGLVRRMGVLGWKCPTALGLRSHQVICDSCGNWAQLGAVVGSSPWRWLVRRLVDVKMENLGYQIIPGLASDLELMLDEWPLRAPEKNSPPTGLRDSLWRRQGVCLQGFFLFAE